jgi:hypothetical protein
VRDSSELHRSLLHFTAMVRDSARHPNYGVYKVK